MADDPTKRYQDGRTVSWQDHEIQYAVSKLAEEFPKRTRAEVHVAVEYCKTLIQPSEGREKLYSCVRAKLG